MLVLHDLRLALRTATRAPGLAVTIIGTLALTIGASTAVFAVVNAVLVRPLPFVDPDRLVVVWESVSDGAPRSSRVSAANYLDWRAQNQTLVDLAAFGAASLTMSDGGEAEELRGVRASAAYFELLGVKPIMGRALEPNDERLDQERVIVLSQALWARRFGARPDIVGQTVRLSGDLYTVIGVMPPAVYPSWVSNPATLDLSLDLQQFWIPVRWLPDVANSRRSHVLGTLGRLEPGVTLDVARADFDRLASQLANQYPDTNGGEGATVTLLTEELTGRSRAGLLALLGAALFVWLIACANLASVSIVQGERRSMEFDIRAALGASRRRLMMQVSVEAVGFAALGGVMGLLVAAAGMNALVGRLPASVPLVNPVTIDNRVLMFVVVLSGAAATILAAWSGLARFGGAQLSSRLGSRVTTARPRVQRLLVCGQLALAVTLTLGAGLLIRSVRGLTQQPPGFDVSAMLLADIALPRPAYAEIEAVERFQRDLLDRLRELPGVRDAAIAYDRPFEATWTAAFQLAGDRPNETDDQRRSAWLRLVSPGYFETLRIPLLDGRVFESTDGRERPGVVVVNESFARTVFGGANPIGRVLETSAPRYTWGDRVPRRYEIVGIVGDVRFRGIDRLPEPAFYLPTTQFPLTGFNLTVRTTGDPIARASDVRMLVRRLDPEVPLGAISTIHETLSEQLAERRMVRDLVGLFGGTSLALAALGLYGLLAFAVASRTRELGIRLALGAAPSGLTRQFVLDALSIAVIGIFTGLIAALAISRALRSLLYGVDPSDPLTMVGVAALLVVVALAASYIPAKRAASLNPVDVLKAQ